MNEEISYNFKDETVKNKFDEIKDDSLLSFLNFLTKRYQSLDIIINKIDSIEIDKAVVALELNILINNKNLILSISQISGFYNLEDGNKMMRFINNGEPVSVTYKLKNTEIMTGMNPYKLVILVYNVKGLFDIEFICDKEYNFLEDKEKIVEYFQENTFDNPRVTTLLNILTNLVDVNKCNIVIKHGDDLVLYNHGVLMKYKETLIEGKKTKILSTYFDNMTNKYVEEKIIKNKKNIRKYDIL